MDSEQHNSATQEQPAEEKATSSAPAQGHGSHRHGQRRSRFKRDNRRGRGDRRDRQPRPDQPMAAGEDAHKPPGNIRKAIDQLEQIRLELKKALDDIHDALRTLEQVEREKTASEEEIELLRENLRMLHRDHGQSRHSRNYPPPSSPASSPAPSEEESEQEPD